MDLQPILAAPFAIQLHLATVLPALALGTWLVVLSRKGSPGHRALGTVYLALMTTTAIAALFVRAAGHGALSPLHLFVPLTLWSVFRALWCVRHGDIAGHRRAMLVLYVGGLLLAGTLTLLPGRLMHRVLVAGPMTAW